jgi:hypothetical protein
MKHFALFLQIMADGVGERLAFNVACILLFSPSAEYISAPGQTLVP